MTPTFRLSTILRESLHNLRGHLFLTLCVALTAAAAGAGAVASSAIEVAGILNYERTAIGRGSTVFSVSSVDNSPISGARCDALNSVSGVKTAGAVIDNRSESFQLGGSRPAYVTYATPGVVALVWPGSNDVLGSESGPVVGSSLAAEFGLVENSSLIIGSAVYDSISVAVAPSPRDGNYDNRVVIPIAASPDLLIRTCLVDSMPGSRSEVESLLTGWFPSAPPVFVASVVPPGTFTASDEMMEVRLSQYSGLGAGVLIAMIYGLTCTMRRSEYALYQVLGLPPGRRLIMLSTETIMAALLPFSFGSTLALITLMPLVAPQIEAATLELAKSAVLLILLPLLGLAITATGGPIRSLKQG